MKKQLFILLASLFMSGAAEAITNAELSDSLYQYGKQYAYLGYVQVKTVRQKGNQIFIKSTGGLEDLSLSPAEIQQLREQCSLWIRGDKKGKVTIYVDNKEIGDLVTVRYKARNPKDCHRLDAVTPLTKNLSNAAKAQSGLDGKHIALWGSHGIYYVQDYLMWKWQRARLWTTVEDLYTSSYTHNFLVPMLENAGAVVIQPRERDIQLNEIIVDETETGYTMSAYDTKKAHKLKKPLIGWGRKDGPLYEGENPFKMGGYYMISCSETPDTVRYMPAITEEGDYAVYVSYATLNNSTDKAEYIVLHKGQRTRFQVNQQMGGGTWVYLGTFRFGLDNNANGVLLVSRGDKSRVITADAVKFGGGWGSVARYPQPGYVAGVASSLKQIEENGHNEIDSAQLMQNRQMASTSGYPRFIEGARYWMQYSGIPDSVYNFTESRNDYVDDYASRGRWVNYLAGGSQAYPEGPGLKIPVNLSLAFHSDAGTWLDDRMVGTLSIYTDWGNDGERDYPAGGSRICNRDFADLMQTQIVEDIRHTMVPDWPRRRLDNSSYAESRNPKVPSALLELLSHQNYADMLYGLNPEFKFIVSRAIYKSMLKFLHAMDGTPYVVQPLPVHAFAIRRKEGTLRLSWQERVDSLEETAHPTYYILYTRTDDGDWDNGTMVSGNTTTVTPKQGVRYDFKVCAGNEGGLSMESEILSAYIAPNEKYNALIVNGFTRVAAPDMAAFDSLTGGILPYSHAIPYKYEIDYIGAQFDYDRMRPWRSDDDCGFGMCFADKQKEVNIGNTYDYPSMHGRVLAKMGISYVSASIESIRDDKALAGYTMVDVILGKQKNAEGCIPQTFRSPLTQYLQDGGHVLLSGSYIASNMQSEQDTLFAAHVLHYCHKTSRAAGNGKFNTLYNILPNRRYTFFMEPNTRMIECEAPDGIEPMYGAKRLARYDDSGVCAGIMYEDMRVNDQGKVVNGERMLVLPFMMESVLEFDTLYHDCVNWLNR